MKIGITCYPTYGGSGVVATELGMELARLGHEIHFISYAQPYRLNEFFENIFYHEVKVPHYPLFEYPPYALALASRMVDVALHSNLQLIHVHYAIPHAISAFLAREMIKDHHRLKIITTLHGTDITLVGADPSFKHITRFGINQSDAVTAVSRFLKEETERIFSPAVDIQIIPNFIQEHPQQQKRCNYLRKRLAPAGEFILMHLSNFRPVKRVPDTIRIAHRVNQKLPVKLVLIGDGPDRDHAEQLARELGIEQQVIFMGKQENIFLLLSIADVFLMPSETESFGLAALEAMSCGVPCVTTNTGGLPEVNIHGETGFTASVGDIDTMSEYVIQILSDPVLKAKLSQNARKHAFENFHASKIIPLYINLYESIL